MTAHDDERIDAALEALARPDPPVDHVARVLARTAGERVGWPSKSLRPRWILPIAATVFAALGGSWLIGRSLQTRLDVMMGRQADVLPVTAGSAFATATADKSEHQPYPLIRTPVDLPVLPPEAYWAMDPFEEWERLRPGTGHRAPTVGRRAADTGPRTAAPSVQGAWATETLPPIELDTIETASIDIAPLAPLDDITVTAITLAPIVIAPVDVEEKP
jgi:hypothetical protein